MCAQGAARKVSRRENKTMVEKKALRCWFSAWPSQDFLWFPVRKANGHKHAWIQTPGHAWVGTSGLSEEGGEALGRQMCSVQSNWNVVPKGTTGHLLPPLVRVCSFILNVMNIENKISNKYPFKVMLQEHSDHSKGLADQLWHCLVTGITSA